VPADHAGHLAGRCGAEAGERCRAATVSTAVDHVTHDGAEGLFGTCFKAVVARCVIDEDALGRDEWKEERESEAQECKVEPMHDAQGRQAEDLV